MYLNTRQWMPSQTYQMYKLLLKRLTLVKRHKLSKIRVTYPLTTAMLSVPKAVTVRGYSFFGDSYVYVIFKDGTNLYWAQSRVLEYLSQVASSLPPSAKPELGPDATGVGWIYEYALVDKTGQHDLSQLTTLQNWFLKYELQTVPGVSEVATIGGMVKQYQITLDPNRLRAYGLTLEQVKKAIQNANQEVGGSVIELGESEHMVRASGYIKNIQSIKNIPLGVNKEGTPILLSNLADVTLGPEERRGVAELNGQGEVVGGVIVMRFGENALKTIQGVKAKLHELQKSLPKGVKIVETYDRSGLILRAIHSLQSKLFEESIMVTLICLVFLFSSTLIIDYYNQFTRWYFRRIHSYVFTRNECQHYVTRWHCYCNRCHGGCYHRDD